MWPKVSVSLIKKAFLFIQLLKGMRVKSALGQVGLSQVGPGQLGPLIDRPGPILSTFFTRDASMRCVLYIKMFSKSLRD